jgi:monoamine oxidase
MTAWTGGPPAARLLDMSEAQRIDRALASLVKIFKVPRARLDDLLDSWWTHDWRNDPLSRGAYSYTLAGGMGARKKLAAPVQGTLFFAGEACEAEQSGTVAGAIASGRAAAKAVRA